MAISEHLSDELKSTYLRGATSPGEALAIAAHLSLCEQCQDDVRLRRPEDKELGGDPQCDNAHHRLLTLADESGGSAQGPKTDCLSGGAWRRVAKGNRNRPLFGASGLGEAVFLLKTETGASTLLPASAQLVVVLRGALRTPEAAFTQGDIIEAAGVRMKHARAEDGMECLCLVVGDDDMYAGHPLASVLSRNLRTFHRS